MSKGKFDLGAFLAPEAVSESDTVREIPVDDILDNPRNFYPRPDNAALAALMESIQANGLLEPPTVVPAEAGKYRLISGHSRMAALRLLAANRDAAVADRFARVPCRVLPAMTEAQEVCAVIEANRQRVKTPALLAQEAERLTEMYVKRREAGEDLPGRIRDRVAEAMQVSKTKLGNLSAIRNGLKVPGIKRKWKDGDIPEAAALEISRMDAIKQGALLAWMIDNHRPWTIKAVQAFEQSCKQADEPAPSNKDKQEKIEPVIGVDLADGQDVSDNAEWVRLAFIDGHEPPTRMGEYYCRIDCSGMILYQVLAWDGTWAFKTGGTRIDAKVLGWYPLPPREEGTE